MDIMLDEETHDVVFNNSEVTVTQGKRSDVAQRLKVKLLTFLGEWFLDTTQGVPYMQQIFGKVRDKSTIDAIIQEKILEEEDVIRILSYDSEITRDRVYVVRNFVVLTEEGAATVPLNLEV